MERLTQQNSTYYDKAIKQLQEYENTGLTPAEIEQLQKENAELKSRFEKSVELPCKVGDILYTNIGYKYSRLKNRPFSCEVVFIGLNYKYSILNVVYQDGSMEQFNSYDIGKTVFLTREEAEQALKGGIDNE